MGSLFGSDFEGYDPPKATASAIEAFAERALRDMVFVPAGSFLMGNVPVPVMIDGVRKEELILGPEVDPDRPETKVDGFYLSRFEVTNADFDLYANARGLPLRRDEPAPLRQGPYPAQVSYEHAEGFCAWVAEITGQPVQLPSSAQWEYAARSGGQAVAYATQTGAYDYLEDLYNATLNDEPIVPHLPDAYPPNPLGLFAMSSNVGEWVSGAFADPETGAITDQSEGARRVWRGAHYRQQASLNSIFMYGAAGQIEKGSGPWDEAQFPPGQDAVYFGTAIGFRCATAVAQPPDVSSFGQPPGAIPSDFPHAITPLPRL